MGKIFKKIITAILILPTIFTSCDKDEVSSKNHSQKNEHQVSTDQAKIFANSIANEIFSINESHVKNSDSEINRYVNEIQYAISDLGDTLMYAINYGGNNGYIILSGNKSDFPIIAFSEKGSIDINSLDESSPFSQFFNEKKNILKMRC